MPEKELPDGLILAALERAERQTLRQSARGVLVAYVAEHLGLRRGASAARRLHPRLRALADAGLVEAGEWHGKALYALTPQGRERAGGLGALPESPQHRRWREAREAAAERIGGFRAEVGGLLGEAAAALAKDATDSEAWFTLGEKLGRACWRLASATHCLREWPEPGDEAMEVDAGGRSGRRDTTLWAS